VKRNSDAEIQQQVSYSTIDKMRSLDKNIFSPTSCNKKAKKQIY